MIVLLVASVAAMMGAAFDHHGRMEEEHRPVHVKVDQLVSATHARASARSTAEALRELEQNLVKHIVHSARVVLEGPIQEPLHRAEQVAAQVLHQTQTTWEAVATGAKASSCTVPGGDPGAKAGAIMRELVDLRDDLGRLLHQSQRTMWLDPALSSSSASSPWVWVHTSWTPLLMFEVAFLAACAALRMASMANVKRRHSA